VAGIDTVDVVLVVRGTPMSQQTSLASSLSTLLRVAVRRPPGIAPGATIPEITVTKDLTVDGAWLAAYRRTTGAPDDGALPPCAPQVLATSLHLQILQDARFPLPALGMVHIENVIEERGPIAAGATIALSARVSGHIPHDKGTAFQIVTEASVGGLTPWRSTMTALVRGRRAEGSAPAKERHESAPPRTLLSSSVLRVGEDTGRRYASVSGDANPIHLHALTAKAFGFPRAIAHGMWTLARALAEVDATLPPRPRTIAVRFIRPVLLPSSIVVEAARDTGSAIRLKVTPERPGPPHVLGTIEPLAEAT